MARALLSLGIAALGANMPGLLAASPDYERDIKPILRERCYSCHGGVKQKGGLRLDAGVLIHKGGEDGPAILAGRGAESALVKRVLSHDDDERMPPEGKPLPPDQIALLKRWIDDGATFPKGEFVPATPASHWAFRTVEAPPVPMLADPARARNPIDNFVLAELDRRKWKPAPAAEPRALLRRVYLDITGLPPSPAEQDRFLAAPTAGALDGVIDDLLSRPAYGERWTRHWLDVVRYADTNGYERDAEKPFVWRYRDYVIGALNADKPYDRLVLEQLAGDELPDASTETAIATTYLRLGHWDDEPADPPADRFDQLDDIVSTTAQAFLGLTLGCARCHDHKFEPLTARDYYGMVAVFNPLERPRNGRTELAVPAGSPGQLAALAERDRAIEEAKGQAESLGAEAVEQRIHSLREGTPDLPQVYMLREPAAMPPDTHVLLRGSPARRGDLVLPSVPAVLARPQAAFPLPGERTSRRRLGLARWIASPDNPLTARVIVNRVWQQHFGQALVRTPNDFGLMGEPPTHPELLDWLAHWFTHDAGWSLKKLHRLILTSNTWRMGKQTNAEYAASDPENRLLWRMPLRRLEAEAIRDSMLAVSGRLNPRMFGPAMKPRIQQAAIEANTDKEKSWSASDESETARRTIYAFIKRGLVIPMLEVLDLGDTVNSCPKRLVTTVAPQALTLFNGEFVNEQARHFAKRLRTEAGPESRRQIDLAWRLALCRPPTEKEIAAMLSACDAEGSALEQICRVILNLNEFVYPD
jgi:hypothetical protein